MGWHPDTGRNEKIALMLHDGKAKMNDGAPNQRNLWGRKNGDNGLRC